MGEHAAELVILDLADECCACAQTGGADDRICRRSSRYLHRRTHGVINSRRGGLGDQLHASLAHLLPEEKIVLRARNHVHDCIADAKHIEARRIHLTTLLDNNARTIAVERIEAIAAPCAHGARHAIHRRGSEVHQMAFKERVFSGVQPTGNLHLGNYLGALVKFVALQEKYDCIYCIVDLHAITVWQNPAELPKATREVAAAFIACGIDAKRHIVFNQSQVAEHAELAWIFNCVARLGWLNRMTQFKEKAGKDRENASVGLYAYPALMAADILVYRATHVPVGEDQKQHLELSRDIAQKFNNDFAASIAAHGYGDAFFPQPEPLITGEATRVMSLRDGTKKMSKSDASDQSRINLTDDADAIAQKVRRAKTDPEPLPSEEKGLETRPEADNLVGIFAALEGTTRAGVLKQFGNAQFSTFKAALTDLAVAKLSPINSEIKRLLNDPAAIDAILADGSARAQKLAGETMKAVKDIVGFVRS